jgi:hypothetical protein
MRDFEESDMFLREGVFNKWYLTTRQIGKVKNWFGGCLNREVGTILI